MTSLEAAILLGDPVFPLHFSLFDYSNKLLLGLGCLCEEDGTLSTYLPHPRELYNNDGVTFKSLVNYSAAYIGNDHGTLYIGNLSEASDTADLHNGRGLSIDKPFKTLEGAFSYAARIVGANNLHFRLLTDIEFANTWLYQPMVYTAWIRSHDPNNPKKLILKQGIHLANSVPVYFHQVGLQASGSIPFFVHASQNCFVNLNRVSLNGTVTQAAVVGSHGAHILLGSGALSGNVTGKRYELKNNSALYSGGAGPNAIPGTEAGSCDATSTYA